MGEANLDKFERDELDKKSQAEAVMARLTGKGLICQDCGKLCTDILVERFDQRIYKLDIEHKKLVSYPKANFYANSWVTDDWAFHCPHCDSLNIDEEVRKLDLEKQDFSA